MKFVKIKRVFKIVLFKCNNKFNKKILVKIWILKICKVNFTKIN